MNIGKFQESFLEQFKNSHTNFSNLISDPFKQIEEATKMIVKANLHINEKFVGTENYYYNDYEIFNGPFKKIQAAIEIVNNQSFLLFKEVFEFNIDM